MRYHIVTFLAGAAVALGAAALAEPEPLSQSSFPCHEDEVLSYAPQFGPDRVGCVNYEEVGK